MTDHKCCYVQLTEKYKPGKGRIRELSNKGTVSTGKEDKRKNHLFKVIRCEYIQSPSNI